ncbi:MAG: flippase-like domain-containing protein, partial [Chloroflexota bacterium]|nr:flippase-like domain-containing protein [Chloroflexota bacterium]
MPGSPALRSPGTRAGGWRTALQSLLAPWTLVGLGAGLTLLAVVGGSADWQQVLSAAARLPWWVLTLHAAAGIFGGLLRAARWILMLRMAGVQVSTRRALAAHYGAELLGPLPASPIAAAYFLHRSGVPAAASSPVVLATFWTDALYALSGTAVVPGGAPTAVRVLAALAAVALLLGAGAVHVLPRSGVAPALARAAAAGRERLPLLHPAWQLLAAAPTWTAQASVAFAPRPLLAGVALIAPAWVVGCAVTALVTRAAGYPDLTPWRVWATSGTSFVIALASPLPLDLGVSESASVLAYGWA